MTLNSLCLFFLRFLSLFLPSFVVCSLLQLCVGAHLCGSLCHACVVINSLLSPLVGVRVFMIEVKHISFVYENITFAIQCINFTFATYVVGERTYGVFLCSNKFHHHSFPAFWDTELRTNTCPKRCLAENWNSEWLFIQVINKLDTFKILLFRHNNKRYQIILVVDIGFLTFRMNSNDTIIKWNISYEKFGYDIYHIISTVYSCESDIWAFATIVKNMLKMWPKCSAFIRYSIELFNTQLLLKNEDVRANKMKNV